MKITDIKTFLIREGRHNYTFVKVETDEGIYGIGEAGITWKEWAMEGAIRHFREILIGEDPTRIEHIWQLLYRGGFFPGGKILSSAISAIDISLWDILGKSFGVPIYKLLGGATRDRVVCYPHCNEKDIETLVGCAKKLVEQGWRFIRFGLSLSGEVFEPTRSVLETIEMFRAVRHAFGQEIEICVDIHTRLEPSDALYLCKSLEEFRPFFVEDPLRSENPNSYQNLRRHTSVPLAVGEQYASKWEFRQLIEEDLIDFCRLDLCIVGGITEAKKITGWCETHHINIVPHNPLGPASTAACFHLDMASSNLAVQELGHLPGSYLKDVFPVQMEYKNGYLLPSERPGLGIEFDEDAAKKRVFEPGTAPQIRRVDGAFTNW